MRKTRKQYVEVIAKFGVEGELYPKYLIWQKKAYPIDAILNVHPSACYDHGVALLYECQIKGKTHKLFYERDRWFVECP